MFLTPPEQITSRFFVAEFILSMAEGLLRMKLRQVPRATGGKPTSPIFEGRREGHEVPLFFHPPHARGEGKRWG
jgi:hypothetical protein